MDVAAYFQEIIVLIHQEGFVALLKDMPASLVPFVEIDGVARLKGLHHLGEIPLGSLQEKMHVVGKKTVSEKIDSFLLAVKGELL
jgi:hypothetical protein